ncbi:MAG TPA: BMC domain-containing protein [Candidatus Bilophila faecipullorum]|uniref:BMC domain-containing protein n=4 Tax=Bilophila TaxID=35832 RepID=A0A9D1QZC7_9BACT|nr:BMC domain-containing protein [uncultured Bilophila sp.]HIW78409.1 BMC domain-containing protein [Candidatus Bilophila faecipullorum]
MEQHFKDAFALVETQGMVPAIYAADAMLKAANVELAGYENVGSTLVTIIVRGDVAACQASAEAGAAAAAAVGKLTAHNVMPRPERGVHAIVATHGIEALPDRRLKALGMIETFGIVYVLEAVDAMIKSSGVELIGYENVASGYISVLVEGDVSACRTAVEAGVLAVGRMGAQVYSSVVIPSPHPQIAPILSRYSLEGLA